MGKVAFDTTRDHASMTVADGEPDLGGWYACLLGYPEGDELGPEVRAKFRQPCCSGALEEPRTFPWASRGRHPFLVARAQWLLFVRPPLSQVDDG